MSLFVNVAQKDATTAIGRQLRAVTHLATVAKSTTRPYLSSMLSVFPACNAASFSWLGCREVSFLSMATNWSVVPSIDVMRSIPAVSVNQVVDMHD